MSKLFNEHRQCAARHLLMLMILPPTAPLPLREQLVIVVEYEAMRAMIEHAKPYCSNTRDRLHYAYTARFVGMPAASVVALLDLALLEQQGGSVTIEEFRKAIFKEG